jgi:tetratricopeptide (TPR) repeat protein
LTGLTLGCAASQRYAAPVGHAWEQALRRLEVDPGIMGNPIEPDAAIEKIARDLAGRGSPDEQLARVQRGLFEIGGPAFAYDAARTLTARQTLDRRAGNCLSFTSLFIAMGRSLGYRVQAALPRATPRSEKAEDLIVVNTHVVALHLHAGGSTTYDFDRARSGAPTSIDIIDDMMLTALFLNNRGVELLRSGDLADAVVHLDAATRLWPEFAGAWGNLAVAQRRSGDRAGALRAYDRALDEDPGNPTVLANLAALYQQLDLRAQAATALGASRFRQAAPDVLIVQGDLHAQLGETAAALKHYRRAHGLDRARADPLIRIARVELDRGRTARARRAASRASKLEPDHPEVAALLERIRLESAKR